MSFSFNAAKEVEKRMSKVDATPFLFRAASCYAKHLCQYLALTPFFLSAVGYPGAPLSPSRTRARELTNQHILSIVALTPFCAFCMQRVPLREAFYKARFIGDRWQVPTMQKYSVS